jgi:hypothetical protein
MEARRIPHMDKHKGITEDWNCDATCMLTLLPLSGLENLKHLIFIVQSIHKKIICGTFLLCYVTYMATVQKQRYTK